MNGETPTVFIVDDAREVRKSLSRVLTAAGYRVRTFKSAESFLDEDYTYAPGCLLLDICLPGLSGMQLQRAMAGSLNMPPIVFLTGTGDVQTGVEAMKRGAVDFLTKPFDCVRLFAAVRRAFQLDEERRLQASLRQVIRQRFDTLTPREREVMARVVRGLLNRQIAAEMGTSDKTVKLHRARVMSKMHAYSVPELVQLGARVGVEIQPDLDIESMAISWRQPAPHSSGRLECETLVARAVDRAGRVEALPAAREMQETHF
jgi:FixJ family two-component response regulator